MMINVHITIKMKIMIKMKIIMKRTLNLVDYEDVTLEEDGDEVQ